MEIEFEYTPKNLDQIVLLGINERVNDILDNVVFGSRVPDAQREIIKLDKTTLENFTEGVANPGESNFAKNLISKIDYILESKDNE